MPPLLLAGVLAGQLVAQSASWTNPLVLQRADPHVTYHDGHYLMTATVPEYDRLELRRASSLDGLRDATPHVIWRRHASGPMSWHIWAPELHRIAGKWYVYFAASRAEEIWAIRMYVLENAASDPLTGTWVEKGQIRTPWETFSLDATTFEHRGARYLAWAQKDPDIKGNTNLYLAKMATPWSIIGDPVRLSKPDLPWEQVKYWVNEGPAVLTRNGHSRVPRAEPPRDRRHRARESRSAHTRAADRLAFRWNPDFGVPVLDGPLPVVKSAGR